MRRYIGLDTGISGLVTLKREPSLRPVQIMRQFKPHSGQTLSPAYPAYHANQGLSSALQKSGEAIKTYQTPIGITNLISRVWGYCGYAGLGFVRK